MWRATLALIGAFMIGDTAMAANAHVTTRCNDAQLCAALDKALSQAPNLPKPLEITLVIEKKTSDSITGHLSWRGAAQGRGETLTLDVMDTTLSPRMYERFMRDLLRHGGLPS